MITDEKIARINALAQKSRTPEGLTEAEKAEQAALRREYVDAVKQSLQGHYVPFLTAYSKALGNNEYYEQVLRVIALLDKPERRVKPVELHYSGFTIPDAFVVGYGLDYSEKYRNLPYIGILKPQVYGA